MTRSLRLLPAALLFAAATTAIAQAPAAPPAGAQQHHNMAPPTNLKVLPKDTTADQVHTIMHGYESALGVECEYCHAKNPATGKNDFASDAKPMKERARVMMKMTAAINADYLTQLTDPRPGNPVTCSTCHRGMAKPALFVPPPHEQHPGAAPPQPPPGH